MPHSDSYRASTLRSGKRYKLDGKKRSSDGENITYIERHSVGESEYHSDETEWINWPEWFKTLEQVKVPRERSKTATKSESSLSLRAQPENTINLAISSAQMTNQPMA